MTTGVKITQLRIPAELYERIRENAHMKRQSRNQAMCELMEKQLDREEGKAA